MRGNVTDAMITGDAVVLAVDAESKTFVNVLDVPSATVRLKKDVKIKGQLDYAELTPAGLLYVSRSETGTNAEVNVIDLAKGEPRFKDAIESGKAMSRVDATHAVDGRATLYVFANRDRQLYAVDRAERQLPGAWAARSSSRAARIRSRWRSGPKASCSSRRRTWWCWHAKGR